MPKIIKNKVSKKTDVSKGKNKKIVADKKKISVKKEVKKLKKPIKKVVVKDTVRK